MSLAIFDRDMRCRRLEEMGFEFNSKVAKWYDRYYELIEHARETGNVRITESENYSLAQWVYHQRYRRNKAKEARYRTRMP